MHQTNEIVMWSTSGYKGVATRTPTIAATSATYN